MRSASGPGDPDRLIRTMICNPIGRTISREHCGGPQGAFMRHKAAAACLFALVLDAVPHVFVSPLA